MKKVVIIGAGPAGITAGYELVKKSQDYEVVILEESNQVGGIAKTVEHNGNRMDLGGHRFISNSEEVKNWWEDILSKQGQPAYDDRKLKRYVQTSPGGPDPEFEDEVMLVRKRISSIYFNEKFFEYPVKLNSTTIKNMGLGQTAKAGFSYLESSIFKKKENNLEGFYVNHYGKQLYQLFFEGYTEKLWGRHPSQISADWGAQRMKGLTISSILKDTSNRKGKQDMGDANTSLSDDFLYPKLGPGQLWEIAAKRFEEKGGRIMFGCKAKGIETANNVIKGVNYIKDGEEVTIEADIVISSMPVKDLIAGMKHVPFNVEDAAKGLPYRDLVVLGILVPSLKIQNTTKIKTLNNLVPECWIYVQDTTVKLGRIQIYNNWSPYMVSNPDETAWIGLEYFCNEGDYYWNQSDIQWQTLAVTELIKMGIIDDPPKILDFHKEMVKKAYPAYFDTYSRFDEIRTYLDNYPNLYCIGRNGQHRYNNMDHTMMTAFETVRTIMSGKTDKTKVWSVNMSREYNERVIPTVEDSEHSKPVIYVEGAADNKPAASDPLGEAVAAAKEEESKKKSFNPMMSIRDRLSRRSIGKPKGGNNPAVNYALLSGDNDDTDRGSYRAPAVPVRSNYQDPGVDRSSAPTPPIRRKPSGVHNKSTMPEDTYVVGSAPVKKESTLSTKPAAEQPAVTEPVAGKETAAEAVYTEPAAEEVKTVAAMAEPVLSEAVASETLYTEPAVMVEPASEPVFEQPVVSEETYSAPVEVQPEVSESVYSEPAAAEPEVSESVYSEPAAAEPEISEEVYSAPAAAEPEVTEEVYSEPVVTEPEFSDTVYSVPAEEEPVVSESVYSAPAEVQSEVTESVYSEPVYTEPQTVLTEENNVAEETTTSVVGSAKFNPANKEESAAPSGTGTVFTPRYFHDEPPMEEYPVPETTVPSQAEESTYGTPAYGQPFGTETAYGSEGYAAPAYTDPAYTGQPYAENGGYGYEEPGYEDPYADYASRNEEYDTTYSGDYGETYGYETSYPEESAPAAGYGESPYPESVSTPDEPAAPVVETDGAVQKSNDFGNLFAMPTEDETKGKKASFNTPYNPVAPTISLVPKKEEKKEFLDQTSAAYTMEKVEKVLKTEISFKPKKGQEEEPEVMVVSVPRPSFEKAKGVFTPKPMTEEEKARIEAEERAKRPIAPSINFKKKEEEPVPEEPKKSERQRPRKKNFARPKVRITADWETMNAKTLRELPELEPKKEEEVVVKVQKSDLPMYDIYADMTYDEKDEGTVEADAAIAASLESAARKEAIAKEQQQALEAAIAAVNAGETPDFAGTGNAPAASGDFSASGTEAGAAKVEITKPAYTPPAKKNISDIEVPKDLFANARVIAVIKNGVKTSTTPDGKQTQTAQPVKKTIQKYTSDFETTTVKSIRKLRAKRQEEAIQSITRMLEGAEDRKIVSPKPKQSAPAPTPSFSDALKSAVAETKAEEKSEPEGSTLQMSAPETDTASVIQNQSTQTPVVETPVTEIPVVEVSPAPSYTEDAGEKEEQPVSLVEGFSLYSTRKPKNFDKEAFAQTVSGGQAEAETVAAEPATEETVAPVAEEILSEEPAMEETSVVEETAAGETVIEETAVTEETPAISLSDFMSVREPVEDTDKVIETAEPVIESSVVETEAEEESTEPVIETESEATGFAAVTGFTTVSEFADAPAAEAEVVIAPEPPKKRTRKTVRKEDAGVNPEGTEATDGTVKKTRKTRSKKTVEAEGQIKLDDISADSDSGNESENAAQSEEASAEEAPKPKRSYRKRAPKADNAEVSANADAGTDSAVTEEETTVKKSARKPRAKKSAPGEYTEGTTDAGTVADESGNQPE